MIGSFEHLDLGFVSDFDIRISNFDFTMEENERWMAMNTP